MVASRLFEYLKHNKKVDLELLICEESSEAEELRDVCRYFEVETLVFPDFRAAYLDDLRSYKAELHQLFGALSSYYSATKKPLVISPLKTLLFAFPDAALLASKTIAFADTIALKDFKEEMLYWGYSFVDIVQVEGEISFRGDIIDIYVPNTAVPYRISLFDDEIEDIKTFDVQTQRTTKGEIESFLLTPAFYALDKEGFDAMSRAIQESQSDSFLKDMASLGFWYLGERGHIFLENKKSLYIKEMSSLLQEAYELLSPQTPQELFEIDVIEEAKEFKPLAVTNAKTLIEVHKSKKITLIATNEAQIKQSGIYDTTNLHVIYEPYILNIIGDEELILSLNKPQKKRRRRRTSIVLDDLKPGDYVVHEEYGVGTFETIEQVEILGGIKDFVVIKYMGDDKVLLPVENLEYIDRYIASSGSLPTLDRLGKGSFGRLKEKVKKRLFEIASEIMNTAAARALIKAPQIKIDAKLLKQFQESAGFVYTEDQEQSIQEIIQEISTGRVMDRLLSGDVGFGKTEVAMNAIFATAKSGYQSALIVPTTLLSSQHYQSLQERFKAWGVRVNKLDRFVSTKEKNSIIKSLASGDIDVVVGTHALFGVEFAKLGLVIVDEEHKFGVKQKEKLKQIHEKVHLLSMSATPIPRSLNQALSSIKTMSSIMTPPSERQGVRTFVKAYDDKLIKEVIMRELRRGGQIFYVHNSIDHMPIKEGQLKKLLPNLKIVMLHSKISSAQTEKELLKFQAGAYDLMIATSIIESGIHMPNVNTMIIDGADRFGIADLHQLRGRVGRSNKEGYAYFVVEDKETITPEAKKRLVALESNSFLGSGSVLAYHDLEIRGGGNLVGDAQSGHIKNIGYSLYLKMLEDAITTLSSEGKQSREKVDIKLTISAYLSDEVINEDRLRLELYRRLSQCETPKEIYEIEEECIDRFGTLNTPTKQFFELMVIKMLSLGKKIKVLSNYGQNINIEYQNGSKERIMSASKDDDDIIIAVLEYLRNAKPKKI
jgi:transcription-repair coupling factor (superfamily II helicase)